MAMTMRMKNRLLPIFACLFFGMSFGFSAFEVNYNLAPAMNETLTIPYVAFSAIASGTTATDTMYIDFNRDLILASFFHDNESAVIIEDSSTYNQSGTAGTGTIKYEVTGPSSSCVKIESGPILYNYSYNVGYDWTISFWLRVDELADGVLLDNTVVNGAQTNGWRIFMDYISGSIYNVKFQYWDVMGVMHQVTIPYEEGNWKFFTFTMESGTHLRGYKDSSLVGESTGDSYLPISAPIQVGAPLTNSSQVFQTLFDDFTVFKRKLTLSQIVSLEGNKKMDVAMSKTNLGRNATYDTWVVGKKGDANVWEGDYVRFYTSNFGQPPEENQAPTIILSGTNTGWVTCNSEEPYINFIISDDSPAQFTCTLYIDGVEKGDTVLNATVGSVSWTPPISSGAHLVYVTCSDIYNATGTSDTHELLIENCHWDTPFKVCAYDNETLAPLDATVVAHDEFGRHLVYDIFEECYETIIPIAFGDYYYFSVGSPGYLPHTETISPIGEYDNNTYLSYSIFAGPIPVGLNLSDSCYDVRVGEKIQVEMEQEGCTISVYRCDSPVFPSDCDFIGFTSAIGFDEFEIEVSEQGYYNDYIIIKQSCGMSLTCMHIIEPEWEVPGLFVNLAKNPEQGAFMVMILILGGFVLWTIE